MAYAKFIKKLDVVEIRGKRGKILVDPYEADHILADLQVLYHLVSTYSGEEKTDEENREMVSEEAR